MTALLSARCADPTFPESWAVLCDYGDGPDRCTNVVDPDDYGEVWTQRHALDMADSLGWSIGDHNDPRDLCNDHKEER